MRKNSKGEYELLHLLTYTFTNCSDLNLNFCCLIFKFFKFNSFSLLKGKHAPLSNSVSINVTEKKLSCNIENGINLSVISLKLKFYLLFELKIYQRKQIHFFLFTCVFLLFSNFFLAKLKHNYFRPLFLSHLLACYAKFVSQTKKMLIIR